MSPVEIIYYDIALGNKYTLILTNFNIKFNKSSFNEQCSNLTLQEKYETTCDSWRVKELTCLKYLLFVMLGDQKS